MDEEDIESQSEEKWVCSHCSGSSVGSQVYGRKKFVILVKEKCLVGKHVDLKIQKKTEEQ